MKTKVYLRLGRTSRGIKVTASSKPNYTPFDNGYYNKAYLPTVMFAVVLDLPDDIFSQAEKVIGEIKIGKEKVQIAATIPEIEIKNEEVAK